MRLSARVVTGALLVPLLALPAAGAPPLVDRDDAQTVVVPGRDGEDRLSPLEAAWRSTAHGIAFAAGSEELSARHFYRLTGSDQVVEVAGVGHGELGVGPGGTVVVLPTGYDVTRGRDVRVLDGATGQEVRRTLVNGYLIGLTDGGVLTGLGGNGGAPFELRLTDLRDGATRTLATVPDGRLVETEADERGAVLAVRSVDGASVDVVAVDLDGTQRRLATHTRDEDRRRVPVSEVRVSPAHVAFRLVGAEGRVSVAVLRRDGTGTPQVRPLPDVQGVAVTDDAVAWTGRSGPGSDVPLHTAPHDPAQPVTVVPVRGYLSTRELQTGPGGFVVPQGASQPTPGFALVRPGSTAVEPFVSTPPEPAVLDELTLDAGRLVVGDEVLDADLALRDLDLAGGRVVLGPERVLRASGSASAQTLTGTRVLSLEASSTGNALVVRDERQGEQLRVPVGADLQGAYLSGRRLLVETGDDAGTTGVARLHDVPTGVTLDLPRGASLWGPYVAHVDGSGRVVRRDLDRPGSAPVVVRTGVRRDASVQVDGDDVLVDTGDRASGRGATVSRIRGTAVRTAAVPQLSPDTGPLLGGGALLVVGGQAVQVLDVGDALAGASPLYVGSSAEDVPAAVDDDVVAWQGGDGRVRVRPQLAGTARAARVLSTTAAAVTAFGDWRFEAEVSEPLSAARVQLRDGAGRTVATLPTTGLRSGSVRAEWDGLLSDGELAPDGVYRWVLSGSDADGDGPLAGADGGAVRSGTVAVRRREPTLSLSAPGVSATASAGRSFPVRWTAPAGLRVDLRYAEVVAGSAGPSRPWLTGTTARSAVFGVTGAPRVVPGRTYRITAVARDEAGRTSPTRVVTVAVPLDDRASGLRYAGAWSSTPASGRYGGTLRTSSARGASVTVSGPARSLHVVADRCATCGRFDVVLDGRVVARVDTRASSTRVRQVVWSRALPGAGRHVLQLRVVSGRVALDGIALGQ